ncbi:hypothetical protein M501DRAFT_929254 [Patellaria atrata CBS 101060]|uniref:Alpha/beta hydrolase fold-3 domain-containing protein n=1 Tax=Patellaria atrata CBS 101060 TaxID=1346257 RepID=A0A9P4SFI8_9PEZI|nr:hypothetical protein M501DRAFT_929254 [Patellaria atrata CBS 101060]
MEAGIPDPYPGVSFKDHKINNDGVTARVFRRKDLESLTSTDGTKAPLFLIFHGGGFSLGSHYTEVVLIKVATSLGFVVVSIDYRRVPESRFPGPFDDCFEGLLWTIKNGSRFGGDVSKIFIGGSSAGANLATAVTLKARDEAMKEIKGQILLIPNTCHYRYHPKDKYELESLHSEGDQLGISGEAIKYIWDEYAPDQGANPYVSPLLAESHANLPPTYIQVAGGDVLRDEGIAYAEALKAAGCVILSS